MVIPDSIAQSIYVISLIAFLIIDFYLLFSAKNEDINNQYYRLHKKWGFFNVEVIKILGAIILIYELRTGTIKTGTIMAIIFVYCYVVAKFFIDYISFKRRKA